MSFGYSIGDFIKVIELVKELRSRFVDAPPQYQAIKEELRGLFIVLEDVDAILPHRTLTNKQRDNFQCLTSTCHHIAEALKDKLSVYQEIDTDRPRAGDETLRFTLRRAWKRIKWEPKDIAELRSRMISSVLLLKEFHAHLNSQRTSEESGLIRDGISEIKTLQLSQERSKEHQEIVEWLTPIEFHSQQNDFYKQRQEGTGQWLLTNPEFNSWLNGKNQTLFCPGAPGAGKTSFTSLVVRHLEDRFGHDPGIGITYLYVNYHRREEQEPVSLLASLLKQLIQGQTTVPECVKVLYNRHHSRRSRPSLAELIDTYPLVARLYSRIFVLLDALDECECSHGSRRLFLSSVFKLQSATPLNLFATSRHIPEIQTGFERHGSKVLEIRATDSDIQRYVVGRLPQLPTFVLSNHGLQSEVVAQIRNAVDGMFLLAKIHFDSLVAKRSPKAVRVALRNLPKGSDSYSRAYDMVIERINDQAADARNLANQALAWVVCSRRPLSPLELQHALALEEGATEFDEDNISTIDDILSVCAGLLIIGDEQGTVCLVHYTAQEYFKENLVSWVSKANIIVSTGCITYLSFDEFSTGPCTDVKQYDNRSMQFRLFDYCARNWGHHASDAISAVTDMLIRMLQRDGNRASCWQAVRLQAGQWRQQVQKDWQISAMHLVVDFELAMIVQQLVNEGFPADSRDRKGRTPLSYAASNGNEAIAFALLEQNVAVDSKDDDGRTPLSYAASHGYDAIVQTLLQRGAEVDSRDHSNYTPLFYAAQKGHNQVVCILLGSDAKPHRKDHHGRIPLSHAAWYGRQDVLNLLIQAHQPDIEDRYGRTILSYAASSGNEAIAGLLLDQGAEVDSTDCIGRTPLFYAAWNGHELVCRLLLERGADAALQDNHDRTPLCYAAMGGNVMIVKLLLERTNTTRQIDNRDCSGRTPLSYAASSGNASTVECLLEQGEVDPASRDITGRTPLFYATYSGHMAAVKLFLSKPEVDPLSESNIGRSPLSIAAEARYFTINALLIQECKRRGVAVGHVDQPVPTAFAPPHIPHAGCDSCMSWIQDFDIEYHCALCNSEGVDICQECFASGASCFDPSHKPVKRRIMRGEWLVI